MLHYSSQTQSRCGIITFIPRSIRTPPPLWIRLCGLQKKKQKKLRDTHAKLVKFKCVCRVCNFWVFMLWLIIVYTGFVCWPVNSILLWSVCLYWTVFCPVSTKWVEEPMGCLCFWSKCPHELTGVQPQDLCELLFSSFGVKRDCLFVVEVMTKKIWPYLFNLGE